MVKDIKENKKSLIFCIAVFLLFAFLAYLFPYTSDDWEWGSINGVERLKDLFAGYNGRYLGNILVLLLTRSVFAKVFCISTSLLIIGLAVKRFSDSKGFLLLPFSFVMLFAMSKNILNQSVVWTSGYANYVTSTVTVILYFLIIKNIFTEESSTDSKKTIFAKACCTFALGLAGSLFVENVTLFNLAIPVIVAIFAFIRFKKLDFVNAGYFVGSVVGAVIMFSNSAYRTVYAGEDFYRTSFLETKNIWYIFYNITEIFTQLFSENCLIFVVIAVLCIVAGIVRVKVKKENKNNAFVLASSLAALACSVVMAFINQGFFKVDHTKSLGILIYIAIAFAYTVSIGAFVLFGFDDKTIKRKILFLLMCTIIIIAPFLVVQPFGGRCLFTPHVFLVMIAAIILNYIVSNIPDGKVIKIAECTFVVLLAGVLAFYSYIYTDIHKAVKQREGMVEQQKQAGCDTITVSELPHSEYYWDGNPYDMNELKYKFRLFYNIDENVEIECKKIADSE